MLEFKRPPSKFAIPRTFQSKVCMCDEGYLTSHDPKHNKMNHCVNCLKPFRWYLAYCRTCGDVYIRDFRAQFECARHPACWNCLQAANRTEPCCEVSQVWKDWQLFGPLGLNPKKFTAEETIGIFDSGGPF